MIEVMTVPENDTLIISNSNMDRIIVKREEIRDLISKLGEGLIELKNYQRNGVINE